jgi:hypothetical protein
MPVSSLPGFLAARRRVNWRAQVRVEGPHRGSRDLDPEQGPRRRCGRRRGTLGERLPASQASAVAEGGRSSIGIATVAG